MKLLETLEKTLKKEPNFLTDNGELKKWVIEKMKILYKLLQPKLDKLK
jgi:hypothetical protein